MTILNRYYKTDETFKDLAEKLRLETREVKFGPLNAMKKDFSRFPKPWVGEIDERGEYFKLFRTKGSDYTSDFSVYGKYAFRNGQTMVHVQHKLHYSALIGFAGLAVFVVAVFFLASKKGIHVHPAIQVLATILTVTIYGYSFYRDLRTDEKNIRQLIYAKLIIEENEDDEDDEDEDGDKFMA